MSEFLARKVKTYFRQIDLNNDGYISLKDFVGIAERHCDTEKADSVEREKITGYFIKVSYFQQYTLITKLVDDSIAVKLTPFKVLALMQCYCIFLKFIFKLVSTYN